MEQIKPKIVSLTRNHLPIPGETPKDVESLIVRLAQKANKGEIRAVAITWIEGNNDTYTSICEGSSPASSLVAGVTALFFDINTVWNPAK